CLAPSIVNYLMTLGWSPAAVTGREGASSEIAPWDELEAAFALADVNKSPAYFDLKKLAAFNGEYIRMMSVDELVAACDPWLPESWDRARFAAIAPHLQPRLVTLADAPNVVDFLFTDEPEIDEAEWEKVFSADYAVPLLAEVAGTYADCDWHAADLKETME